MLKNLWDDLVLWYLNKCITNALFTQFHMGTYRWYVRIALLVLAVGLFTLVYHCVQSRIHVIYL